MGAVCWLFAVSVSWGFEAPIDRAGPLRVTLVGPEQVREIDRPFPVRIEMTSDSDIPLQGNLQLRLIDGWTCDPPEGMHFSVESRGSATYQFQIQPSPHTLSAHYPIHALASFSWQGNELSAHPILILSTEVRAPNAARPPPEWKPVTASMNGQLALWQLPAFRFIAEVFGQPSQTLPSGWTGTMDGHRASFRIGERQRLAGETRTTVAIHPPWADSQVGTGWIEFPLQLPNATPITLRFATAVTPDGNGDGVTFRVRAVPFDSPEGQIGEIVFERHSVAKQWEPAEANLDRFSGQSIRLQLESHPGPAKNTSFDQSFWAEPTLVTGRPAASPEFPPTSLEGMTRLGTIELAGTTFQVSMVPGQRGLLDAAIGFADHDRQLFFRGFRARMMGMQLDELASPAVLVDVQTQPLDQGLLVRHKFTSPRGSFDLVGRLEIKSGVLRVRFQAENTPADQPWFAPHLEDVSLGSFSEKAQRVYAGHGNVLTDPEAFELSFDGHRLATSHVGFDFSNGISLVEAVDLPPLNLQVTPETREYSLHVAHGATWTLIPSKQVWEGAKVYRQSNGLKSAGGVKQLAGRFAFDLWSGRYGDSSGQLQRAFRYGLTDAVVIWHNWQRWGYDYRLPDIYPPNPRLGTEAELQAMIDACRQTGVLFALHDNYIDMYPDASDFSYERNIAFREPGKPVPAWLNEGRQAQSYRFRADRIGDYLRPNLELLHQKLRPTAYFIDVWSSVRPYDYWTSEGRFVDCVATRDEWGKQFAWIRDRLGSDAPQISESGHDQLIGWLDGAQTNHLRVGEPVSGDRNWTVWNIRCQDAERIPWFDFAHHDRFALHGAGYSNRYQGGLDARNHGIYSDDYLATEVLTGHPVMVSEPFGRNVVRKYWLTQDLMRALAQRTMQSVEFVDGDLHHQHVQWSGGGDVWVNRGEGDWPLPDSSTVLPSFGFQGKVATGEGVVTASVTRREGLVVETASAPQQLYVNGRELAGDNYRVRASLEGTPRFTDQQLRFTLDWRIDDPVPDGYRPFLHFVDTQGEIAFQGGFDMQRFQQHPTGSFQLPATAPVPDAIRQGSSLELRYGFYSPEARGERLALPGVTDSERRVRLGTITFHKNPPTGWNVTWEPLKPEHDEYQRRQNPERKAVSFGFVRTAGGCQLVRQGNDILLIPLPDSGLARTRYELDWGRLPWKLPVPTQIVTLAEDGSVLRQKPAGQELIIEAEPNAFAYRLRP